MEIAQVIHTIQGEGTYLGCPSVLMRIVNCNLNCPYCDTKWASKNVIDKNLITRIDTNEELTNFCKYIGEKYFKNYSYYPHIMVTGGEPLIYSNKLISFAYYMKQYLDYDKLVFDIESNGTLLNYNNDGIKNLSNMSNHGYININISPKLTVESYNNTGLNFKTADEIIDYFKSIQKSLNDNITDRFNYHYKFIYNPKNGGKLINRFVEELNIDKTKCYCMAYTPIHITDQNEFQSEFWYNNFETADFCRTHGYRYSPRQHLYLFGQKNVNEFQK